MAEIRYEYIDDQHPLTTYNEVFNAYSWLFEALKKVFPNGHIDFSVDFKSDNMVYSCDSFDDFKKHAFGRTIEFKNLFFMVRNENNKKMISIYGIRNNKGYQEFTITSGDEGLISDLVEVLKIPQNSNDNNVIVKYEDHSVHIGDGNKISETIIGNGNYINKASKGTEEKWYSKIGWNIVVPIIVGVIVVAICAYLGLES